MAWEDQLNYLIHPKWCNDPPDSGGSATEGHIVWESELVDVPPTSAHLYWYRVAARNRVGVSETSAASAIDVADEAVEAAPHLQPLELEQSL